MLEPWEICAFFALAVGGTYPRKRFRKWLYPQASVSSQAVQCPSSHTCLKIKAWCGGTCDIGAACNRQIKKGQPIWACKGAGHSEWWACENCGRAPSPPRNKVTEAVRCPSSHACWKTKAWCTGSCDIGSCDIKKGQPIWACNGDGHSEWWACENCAQNIGRKFL